MTPTNDSRQYIPSIILALLVSIMPHAAVLPLWVSAWCAIMWAYALLSLKYGWTRPGRLIRNVIAVAGITGLLLTYHTRLDASAYISLLAVMAAIKPLEISSHRDRMVTVFLAYFIVITSLLQSETLLITIYMFVSVLVTTAVLVGINDPGGRSRGHFQVSALIMLQATPVMLVLFFLFPRIEGGLVGMPFSSSGVTGFSGAMRPGSVSSLVTDSSVAFRVEFDDDIPGFEDLYWRGVVFSHFDGIAWHRQKVSVHSHPGNTGGDTIDYTVILEPHRNYWLFALDFPVNGTDSGKLYEDFTLLSDAPVFKTTRYSTRSLIRDHTGATGFFTDPDAYGAVTGNPESRRLARRLSQGESEVGVIVGRILQYFAKQGFSYTMSPPLLGRNPVDDFLFKSKSGYCEHYASAFAFLMRSSGIPARVVGGYLGGEINPYGNYLIVRQSHAHAWVEVWDANRGWVRVDPTLAVSPNRIAGLPEDTRAFNNPFTPLIEQAWFGWDALSKSWDAWFAGYSYEQQKNLLDRLGIAHSYTTGPIKLLLAGLAMVFLLFAAYLLLHLKGKQVKPDDEIERWYKKFLAKLAAVGIAKHPGTGPLEYAEKAGGSRPDLEKTIRHITNLYVILRYSDVPEVDALPRFKKAVKYFRPSKHKSPR
jgi:protein-glutamine gamma-glutamyltransferase